MPRAVYQGVEYESVKYNATTERWYLRPAEGPDKAVLDPELHDLEGRV